MLQHVFTWRQRARPASLVERCSGTAVHVHASEADMLRAWQAHVMAVDPDALAVYEVCLMPHVSAAKCSHQLALHVARLVHGQVVGSACKARKPAAASQS